MQWFTKLVAYPTVYIEQHDHYMKQTFRNRCVIRTEAGEQVLTVPVTVPTPKAEMRDVLISDHGDWRRLHFQALSAAYERSPFFEFYADDFRPFYSETAGGLLDFNQRLVALISSLLDIAPDIRLTDSYADAEALGADDYRDAIHPKHPAADPDFTPDRYVQMFSAHYGFRPNLSIVDLLFNRGPEGLITLIRSSQAAHARFPGL